MERVLIGSPVRLSIGEPWDFESPDGRGTLDGRVLRIEREGERPGEQRIVLEVTPFAAPGGQTVGRLVATARHDDGATIVEHLVAGEIATANFSYADEVPEARREAPPYLIGSLNLAD